MVKVHKVSDKQAEEMIQNIMDNCMLLWMRKSSWGNRKKLADDLLRDKFGEDAKRVRAVKDMIDPEPVRKITYHQGKAMAYVERVSMPYFKDGTHYVRADKVEEVNEYLRECSEKINVAAAELAEVYDEKVKESVEEHPDLYKYSDFPAKDYVWKSFRLEWGWQKVMLPMAGSDSKVSVVSKAIVDEENKKFRKRMLEDGQRHIDVCRAAFKQIITHLRDCLVDPMKNFQETTVEKPKEFLKNFSSLNLWGDKPFEKLSQDALDILDGVYASDLKEDEEYRKAMGGIMDDVVSCFESLDVVELDRALDI
jgi:hypothetical protein